jgi:hypothetical protein
MQFVYRNDRSRLLVVIPNIHAHMSTMSLKRICESEKCDEFFDIVAAIGMRWHP